MGSLKRLSIFISSSLVSTLIFTQFSFADTDTKCAQVNGLYEATFPVYLDECSDGHSDPDEAYSEIAWNCGIKSTNNLKTCTASETEMDCMINGLMGYGGALAKWCIADPNDQRTKDYFSCLDQIVNKNHTTCN